ncbi:MAG: hypothetical protein J7545_01100 [Roseofilum sp. SBFL]|nr:MULTISPECIES: hypothetical protein [unclassified Roseofilum]MBP0014531.1 hypothetical protein [Roseofilum sp. SID3]MBP0024396.1 hypothetical protein [Roseofilum sp. SID2]MBP0037768.1 hypothetical protein [Roseofilum sp. SID1]MBP0040564.1 hypothetical protein [Roseofilum sp. SBFL]
MFRGEGWQRGMGWLGNYADFTLEASESVQDSVAEALGGWGLGVVVEDQS